MCCSDPDVVSVALDFDRGDRGGWAYTDCDNSTPTKRADTRTSVHDDGRSWSNPTLTFEGELPISGSLKAAEPLPTMWWYRRVGATEWTLSKEYPNPTEPGSWEVVACTSARVEPVRFDNTPPPLRPIPPEKIAAAKKAIDAITARQKGLAGIDWPPMWIPSAVYPGYRIGPHGAARLPDTERGRRAAWELEGL